MTKKDFEAIAKIFKNYHDQTDLDEVYSGGVVAKMLIQLAHDLAEYFVTTNPRFDHDRFTVACFDK